MSVVAEDIFDPLSVFLTGTCGGAGRPAPLISTSHRIELSPPLAVVRTVRTFRNDEDHPIEAILTFPSPIHATVFSLKVRTGDRELSALARPRTAAVAEYEAALDDGKTAVLHEELLKGIHKLSVANLGPGQEVGIEATYAQLMTIEGDTLTLRVPTTVGQVYGRSSLSEVDELTTGGPATTCELEVIAECDVSDGDGHPLNRTSRMASDRPLNLSVQKRFAAPIVGRDHAGRLLELSAREADGDGAALSIALLVDRSGSMGEAFRSGQGQSKLDLVVRALSEVATSLHPEDRAELWRFDGRAERVGGEHGTDLSEAIAILGAPGGGTEIGRALQTVFDQSRCRDVLLLTDGKSHNIDVQALAQRGRRVSVVLIGEDSLEANVGRLASMTGGDIFIANDANVSVSTAIEGLRTIAATEKTGRERVAFRRGALDVTISQIISGEAHATLGPAVAALFADAILPSLSPSEAENLAVSAALVTHLTSLVMVDDAGEKQQGVPAVRKVDLPEPQHAMMAVSAMIHSGIIDEKTAFCITTAEPTHSAKNALAGSLSSIRSHEEQVEAQPPVSRLSVWAEFAAELSGGELHRVPEWLSAIIEQLSQERHVRLLEAILRQDARLIAVAILAAIAEREGDHHAGRIVRNLVNCDVNALIELVGAGNLYDKFRWESRRHHLPTHGRG